MGCRLSQCRHGAKQVMISRRLDQLQLEAFVEQDNLFGG